MTVEMCGEKAKCRGEFGLKLPGQERLPDV